MCVSLNFEIFARDRLPLSQAERAALLLTSHIFQSINMAKFGA